MNRTDRLIDARIDEVIAVWRHEQREVWQTIVALALVAISSGALGMTCAWVMR